MPETVVITGGSGGIGEAVARRYHALGANLCLLARRRDRLDALGRELGAQTFVVDVADRAAVAETLALPAFAKVDVLVNNAGLALGMEPAQGAALDDWQRMVDVNINGVLYMTHALLPRMVAAGGGHIVNLGSVAGTYPYAAGNVYGATKAFLHQLSLNLRSDLLGTGVRVTNIEPGLVETEFSVVRFRGDEEKAKAPYRGMQPLTADDIAETIVWCTQRPKHVNINTLELMPVAQAFAGFSVDRK